MHVLICSLALSTQTTGAIRIFWHDINILLCFSSQFPKNQRFLKIINVVSPDSEWAFTKDHCLITVLEKNKTQVEVLKARESHQQSLERFKSALYPQEEALLGHEIDSCCSATSSTLLESFNLKSLGFPKPPLLPLLEVHAVNKQRHCPENTDASEKARFIQNSSYLHQLLM